MSDKCIIDFTKAIKKTAYDKVKNKVDKKGNPIPNSYQISANLEILFPISKTGKGKMKDIDQAAHAAESAKKLLQEVFKVQPNQPDPFIIQKIDGQGIKILDNVDQDPKESKRKIFTGASLTFVPYTKILDAYIKEYEEKEAAREARALEVADTDYVRTFDETNSSESNLLDMYDDTANFGSLSDKNTDLREVLDLDRETDTPLNMLAYNANRRLVNMGMESKIVYVKNKKLVLDDNVDFLEQRIMDIQESLFGDVYDNFSSEMLLDNLSTYKGTDKVQELLSLFTSKTPNVPVYFISKAEAEIMMKTFKSNNAVDTTFAFYNRKKKAIYVIKDSNDFTGTKPNLNNIISKLLHEVLHATTVDYLNSDSMYSQGYSNYHQLVKAKIENSSSYKELSDSDKEVVDYHLASKEEFITGVFENDVFRKLLKNVEAVRPSTGLKNVFQEFINFLKTVFGLSTPQISLLEQAVELSKDLVTSINFKTSSRLEEFANLKVKKHIKDDVYYDLFGAISGDHEYSISYAKGISLKQREIHDKIIAISKMFEEEVVTNGQVNMQELPKVMVKVSTIIEHLESLKNVKNNNERRKYINEEIKKWKLIGEIQEEVERYQYIEDGVVKYVYGRVTDSQSVLYYKSQFSNGKTAQDIKDAESGEFAEYAKIGTEGHAILEAFMMYVNSIRNPEVLGADFTALDESFVPVMVDGVLETAYEYYERIYPKLKERIINDPEAPRILKQAVVGTNSTFRNDNSDDILFEEENLTSYTYTISKAQNHVEMLMKLGLKNLHVAYATQMSISGSINEDFIMYTEMKTYDADTKTAGTKDLFFVYSDGSAGIFDYKFTQKHVGINRDIGRDEIAVNQTYDDSEFRNKTKRQKKVAYNDQMGTYALNAVNILGVTKIHQARMVPIGTVYGFRKDKTKDPIYVDTLVIDGVRNERFDTASFTSTRQYATAAERSYKGGALNVVDEFLVNMEKRTKDLVKVFGNFDSELKEEIEFAINELKVHKNLYSVTRLLDRLILESNDLKAEIQASINTSFVGKDSEGNALFGDNSQVSDFLVKAFNRLNVYQRTLNEYADLTNILAKIVEDMERAGFDLSKPKTANIESDEYEEDDDAKLSFRDYVQKVMDDNKVAIDGFNELKKEMMFTILENDGLVIDKQKFYQDMYEFKDLGWFEKWLNHLGDMNMPLMKIMKNHIEKNIWVEEKKLVMEETDAMVSRLEEYVKWAAANNYSQGTLYNPLIREGSSDIFLVQELDFKKWNMHWDFLVSRIVKKDNQTEAEYTALLVKQFNERKAFLGDIQHGSEFEELLKQARIKDNIIVKNYLQENGISPSNYGSFGNGGLTYAEFVQSVKDDIATKEQELLEKYEIPLPEDGVAVEAFFRNKSFIRYIEPKADVAIRQKYQSDQWIDLMKPGNEPAMNMLLHFTSMNNSIRSNLGYAKKGYHQYSIPNIYKPVAEENASNMTRTIGMTAGGAVLGLFSAGLVPAAIGSVIAGGAIGNAMSSVVSVATNGRKGVIENITDFIKLQLVKNTVVNGNDADFKTNRADADFEALDIPVHFLDNIENAKQNKSRDLAVSFLMMLQSAHTFRSRSNIEGFVTSNVEMIEAAKFMEETGVSVGTLKTTLQELVTGVESTKKKSTGFFEASRSIALEQVYGINMQSEDKLFNAFGQDISAIKTASSLKNTAGMVQLAGNYASAWGGFLSGVGQARVEAGKGYHFTNEGLNKTITNVRDLDGKQMLAELFFDVSMEDEDRRRINQTSQMGFTGMIAKYLGSEPAYMLQYWQGKRHNKNILGAMLHQYAFVPKTVSKETGDGDTIETTTYEALPIQVIKERYPNLIKDGDKIYTLYDAISFAVTKEELQKNNLQDFFSIINLVDVTGKPVVNKKQAYGNFRNKVRKVIGTTVGYNPNEDKAMIQKQVLGNMLMQYRTWIPEMFRERWAGTQYDYELQQIRGGRYRIAAGEFYAAATSEMKVKNTVGTLASLIAEVGIGWLPVVNYRGFSKMETPYVDADSFARNRFELWKLENPGQYKQFLKDTNSEEVAFQEYKNLRKNQLKAFAGEIRIYLGLTLLVLMSQMADVDDEEEYYVLAQAYKVVNRAKLEMSYFLDPEEMFNLATKPSIPMLSFVEKILNAVTNTLTETFDMTTMAGSALFTDLSMSEALQSKTVLNPYDSVNDEFTMFRKDRTPVLSESIKLIPLVNGLLNSAGITKRDKEHDGILGYLYDATTNQDSPGLKY